MFDIIIIVKPLVYAPGGGLVRQEERNLAAYPVNFYRLSCQDDVDHVLKGGRVVELPQDHVLDKGTIHPPDGEALPENSLGAGVCSDYTEAIKLAHRALGNEQSEVRKKGMSGSTPVYVWTPGRLAQVEHLPEETSTDAPPASPKKT